MSVNEQLFQHWINVEYQGPGRQWWILCLVSFYWTRRSVRNAKQANNIYKGENRVRGRGICGGGRGRRGGREKRGQGEGEEGEGGGRRGAGGGRGEEKREGERGKFCARSRREEGDKGREGEVRGGRGRCLPPSAPLYIQRDSNALFRFSHWRIGWLCLIHWRIVFKTNYLDTFSIYKSNTWPHK